MYSIHVFSPFLYILYPLSLFRMRGTMHLSRVTVKKPSTNNKTRERVKQREKELKQRVKRYMSSYNTALTLSDSVE